MVTLISDGGQMTVGRRLASHVWGQFSVTLPEGEKQKDPDDDRIVDGYVYRPDDAGRGRGELTFMRADAKLDMNASRSDLEATLDGASRRTEGDVFYSREISGLGLGRAVPGVDYTVGDVVSVLVWGRRLTLPVTAVTAVSDTSGGAPWRVQVGGQVLRDAAALRKRNDDLQAQIAVEKRQRLRQVGTVDRKATRAQGTADKAAERASELQKFLSGSDGGDLVGALDAINKQLAAQEEPAASGLVPAYLRINAQLWEEQRRIDAIQDQLIRETQESVAAAKQEAAESAKRRAETILASVAGSSHPDFPVQASGGSWSLGGSLLAGDAVRVTRWVRGDDGALSGGVSSQVIMSSAGPVPGTSGLGNDVFVEVLRMSTPLVVRRFSASLPQAITVDSGGIAVPGLAVTVDKGSRSFDVSARVRYSSGWGWYVLQIVRSDGTVLAERRDEGRSNIFARHLLEQQLTVRAVSIPAGQTVTVRVGPGQHRDLVSASWSGSWTERQ